MPLKGEIPVTIITGFLGAGKTTLLNHILKEKGQKSVAVIENEYGAVNIDKQLVAENLIEKEDLVSLQNGCVCCSLRKDIVKAFAEIERRNRQRGKNVDAIVLETTGLADPAPVAFTFFATPWIASRFRLDSIICVVDARYLMQHLEDATHPEGTVNEAVQQIAFADLILLNKVDLVDDEQKERVKQAIRDINKTAQVMETQLNKEECRPSIDKLLFNNLFTVKRKLQTDPFFLDSDSESDTNSEDDLSHAHTEDDGHSARTSSRAAAAAAAAPAQRTASGESDQDAAATAAAEARAAATFEAARAEQAAQRSSGEVGPSTSATSSQQAVKLLAKYRTQPLVGSKRPAEAPAQAPTADGAPAASDCEDNCAECKYDDANSKEGAVAAADPKVTALVRRPKRKAKRLHDLSDVSSVAIMAHGELDEYRFNMFMRDLLNERAKDIFRCKGVLCVHGYGTQKFVFQGVHETICYGPAESVWKEDEPRVNQIVFIGRALERKPLIEGFRSCVWVPLPENWEEFRHPGNNQPYYANKVTGEKSWKRPEEIACARVVGMQGNTQQPARLLPKRQASMVLPSPSQAVNV